jgi:hypothetical protein
MPYVRCDIGEGLRPSEVTVGVVGRGGRSEFLRVEKTFVKQFGTQHYLPVGLIFKNRVDNEDIALIELPHEADSGANRLWVPVSALREADFGQPGAVP